MPITIFQLNDCDWWAGDDLDSVKIAYAQSVGYESVSECESDGLIDDARALTDKELDRLQFLYDWPERTRKASFRVRLQEMVKSQEPTPCAFASTEY